MSSQMKTNAPNVGKPPPRRIWLAAQTGQAVVETAIAIPIVLLVMVGIVDFGRVYFSRVQLENGVSEGARYAAFNQTESAIKTKVKDYAATLALTDTDITIQCYVGTTTSTKLCAGAQQGDSIAVTATTLFQPITPMIGTIIGTVPSLSSSSRRTVQ